MKITINTLFCRVSAEVAAEDAMALVEQAVLAAVRAAGGVTEPVCDESEPITDGIADDEEPEGTSNEDTEAKENTEKSPSAPVVLEKGDTQEPTGATFRRSKYMGHAYCGGW